MKKKSLAIILVLTMLFLVTGSVYSGNRPSGSTVGSPTKAHPWEELNNGNGPSPSSAMGLYHDYKAIMVPIFSDFLIWIYIKDTRKGSDHQESSIKIDERSSYQIIFPW
jgi:hypothetical protein